MNLASGSTSERPVYGAGNAIAVDPPFHYAESTNLMSCSGDHPWLAIVVRSRHEKSVKTILDYKGYRTAVPLVRCIHKRRCGSSWDTQKPLIAGYVFAMRNPENPFRIVTTPGVVQIVSCGGAPGTISAAEMESLERVAASGLPVAGCGYTRVGEAVELIAGPLKGLQGIVLRQTKITRFVVGVELLQRSVAVEIDGAWAAPIR